MLNLDELTEQEVYTLLQFTSGPLYVHRARCFFSGLISNGSYPPGYVEALHNIHKYLCHRANLLRNPYSSFADMYGSNFNIAACKEIYDRLPLYAKWGVACDPAAPYQKGTPENSRTLTQLLADIGKHVMAAPAISNMQPAALNAQRAVQNKKSQSARPIYYGVIEENGIVRFEEIRHYAVVQLTDALREFTFIVHRDVRDSKGWSVTECISGCRVVPGSGHGLTCKVAIQEARRCAQTKTPAMMWQVVNKAVALQDLSPAFKDYQPKEYIAEDIPF